MYEVNDSLRQSPFFGYYDPNGQVSLEQRITWMLIDKACSISAD